MVDRHDDQRSEKDLDWEELIHAGCRDEAPETEAALEELHRIARFYALVQDGLDPVEILGRTAGREDDDPCPRC